MIKLKGTKIIVTGKDEKMLRDAAKKIGISPEQLLISILERKAQNTTIIENGICLERVE